MITFDQNLMKKKEEVEKLRTRIHRLNRDGHVTEKITQQRQITEDLAKNLDVELGFCESRHKLHLVTEGKFCMS